MHRYIEGTVDEIADGLRKTKPANERLTVMVVPGKTLADVVCGQWPGDETDEQIEAALAELS